MNVIPTDDPVEHLLAPRRSKEHAVIYMNPDSVITAWLGASQEIFGYTAEEMVGKPLSLIFPPQDMLNNLDRYELEIVISNSRSEHDGWHVRKNGTRIWVTGMVSAIRDDAGDLVGLVKVARDQTDLSSQVEFLKRHAATLLLTRNRTHRFIRTLGHELRNPLGPLNNAVHAIKKQTVNPGLDQAFQVIARQVGVMTRLAEDLMDITRLETGKVDLKLTPVDLRSVLSDAVASLQRTAAEKGIKLEAVVPAARLTVEIDEARFQRLVLNLLNNAIKYTPRGGSIWVKARQEGEEIVFSVEDTGIGIAADVLPRIFELFTQETRAAGHVPGGLGIGLTMVKEIAELHSGSVHAFSCGIGEGSQFEVRLPAAIRIINRPAQH